ncbi:uncharacterized protein LOC135202943 isoform X2 [Macrobrachium nipponense]|uniref:uncharacterized protein LOC135202943 isoform X2 n=1 Tax=Macrobrachium nipponense TaxID=159736 RepID=UPI0030C7FB9F
MKIVFLFALVAVAAAMPAADPEADPQLLLTSPLTYTYPLVKPLEVKTKSVPLVYSSGLPLTYSFGTYPYAAYPYSYFPYSYPWWSRLPNPQQLSQLSKRLKKDLLLLSDLYYAAEGLQRLPVLCGSPNEEFHRISYEESPSKSESK